MRKFELIFRLDKMIMNIGSALLSIKRTPMLLRDRRIMAENKNLSDYKKSDTCYILGLGPSLRDVDLKKLDGDIIVTNHFTDFSGSDMINPDFYCLIDAFWYTTDSDHFLEKAADQFPQTVFLLNGQYRKKAENSLPKETKRYFLYCWKGLFRTGIKLDLTRRIPLAQNVVCASEMIALSLNYKKIILLGCDFSSFASRKALHCYEEPEERQITMAFELFSYSFVAHTHNLINQYAIEHGIKIYNATKGSLIDAYEYDEELVNYYLKEEHRV